MRPLLVWLTLFLTPQAGAPSAELQAVVNSAKFKTAAAALDRDFDRHVAETIRLTEIPAPPFKEAERAKVYAELFRQHGLSDVEIDAEGNVLGLRRGAGQGPLVAIAAHLDTVFPEGTNVKVRRDGTKLAAPGVGDDSRSLAVLLAIIRALDAAQIQTKADILFVGDVGEEGPGDLRGMKYLFSKGKYAGKITAFISADGTDPGNEIVSVAVGSKRYRVTFKGPGGHSYSDFGLVSPAFAMANAMKKFGALSVPKSPKTTFSVGVVGGGTSINSIPFETWMDVDMRSESRDELNKLDAAFKAVVAEAVNEENAARSTASGKITADLKLTGDRPSGTMPANSRIVEIASASIRHFGLTPVLASGSNDSNFPISLGIPAITLDAGGASDRNHSLDEWIDIAKPSALRGMQMMLATLVTLAGM
ncbi:MAG: M20/M25/M40 family metallo-hydrolase [Acidobacteria bacterium]|nr:MAG: M20/M25/M40 family metallo-hydrolase [Acidobacteriota bacterium]